MEHFNCFLFICLLLAVEIRAIEDGMGTGRELWARDRMLKTSEEEEAEAPGSSTAPEDTGYRTDQTFYCSEELENYLNEANLTIFTESPCDISKSGPPAGNQKCQVTHNRSFKIRRNQLVAVVLTPSANICCELCRAIRECYSWWRRYSDGHCHINKFFTRGAYSSNAAGGHL